MELVLGGVSSAIAGVFTNPLEVIKIRLQLQGELKAQGKYAIHYKNVFQAAWIIGRKEGVIALQKGLVPCLYYQFIGNGMRLGIYQLVENSGFTKNKNGTVNSFWTALVAAGSGVFGNFVGSPFFLVKTHLQSKVNEKTIAVGTQHEIQGMTSALKNIYKNQGITGLWRGSSSQIPRLASGSATQILTFEKSLEFVKSKKIFSKDSWMNAFYASLISGFFVSAVMSPWDLVAIRFYNQGVKDGKGILYRNIIDCVIKVYKKEGALSFFKGVTASYLRVGPYTLISLVVWDRLKYYHGSYNKAIK